jgi:cytochrome c oxidase assembly factor CtaG
MSWFAVAASGPGDWRFDAVALVLTLLGAVLYLAGVARLSRAGRRWPPGRTVAFLTLGIGSLVATSMGWPAAYAPMAFSVYVVQTMAFMLIVPFLLALGRPLELALAALSAPAADRLRQFLTSRAMRLLTMPITGPLVLAVLPCLIFFTPLLAASLAHPLLLSMLHVVLVLSGAAVVVPLWESQAIDMRVPYGLVLIIAFIELLADALPGIVISSDNHVLAAAHFLGTVRPWHNSALHDQQLGGDLLLGIGEGLDLPFLMLLLVQWMRSDARDAAAIDRAYDSRPAAALGSSAEAADDGWERPWWESDASS